VSGGQLNFYTYSNLFFVEPAGDRAPFGPQVAPSLYATDGTYLSIHLYSLNIFYSIPFSLGDKKEFTSLVPTTLFWLKENQTLQQLQHHHPLKILLAKPGLVTGGQVASKFGRGVFGDEETASLWSHLPPIGSLNVLFDSWDFHIDHFLLLQTLLISTTTTKKVPSNQLIVDSIHFAPSCLGCKT
jgi:hypothetical protein